MGEIVGNDVDWGEARGLSRLALFSRPDGYKDITWWSDGLILFTHKDTYMLQQRLWHIEQKLITY